MERALTLGEAAPASNGTQLEAAMTDVMAELQIVADRAGRAGYAKHVADAERLGQNWYRTGLLIVRPPANGLIDVPLPANVMLLDLEDRVAQRFEEAGVNVCDENMSTGRDLLLEPLGNRSRSTADLQAVPPDTHAPCC